MKGYLQQLWNDPAFFANTVKSLIVTAGMGAAAVIGMPMGRSLTEKIVVGAVAALGGGIASLPSARKE